ncbi:hypothetical protein JXA34_03030 [Patescibacteria group bacterium]|nr:hypothetical protein [Patescibacteria group bacterium]
METLEELGLIYNWDKKRVINNKKILDTSLRDGLQDPSIRQPSLEEKIKLIDLMDSVGVDAADIGFPVNSKSHKNEVIETAKHIKEKNLGIEVCVLARTQKKDIEAAIEVSQKAQIPVEVITIVGSSKVRHFVENWNLDQVKKWIKECITLALKNNLEVNFLTEDGTRTEPGMLTDLYKYAIDLGASKVTIADTVGFATPYATKKIIELFKKDILKKNKDITLDWHGHNDRDFGTINALEAFESGADRAHVCILGIGERAGNTAMEPLLVNMKMMGMANGKNLRELPQLSMYASNIFNINIPQNMPIVGEYVHTTSVGIHASAILKARNMYREDLANTVYSGVNPQYVGLKTEIFVGPLSGRANVIYVLRKHGIEPTEEKIEKVLKHASSKNVVLKDDEVLLITKD